LRLSNIFLDDQWVIEEIREEIKSFLEANVPSRTYGTQQKQKQSMSAHVKKTERSQIIDLILHIKPLGKSKQNQTQAEGEK
jgi:siroheme synthase (precorrin-2 oxidase/ferrochelatase)